MNLVFIYGLPGVGKLTVANEVAKLTGYRVFHNHLTVDLADAVFPFSSEAFIKLREKIWLDVFDFACKYQLPGLIFTFVFEKTVTSDFIEDINRIIGQRGKICFVMLECDRKELDKRILSESRKQFGKLKVPDVIDRWLTDGTLTPSTIANPLEINNTHLSPKEAAERIVDFYHLT